MALEAEGHLTTEQIESGIAHVEASPTDQGVLEMIVVRPRSNERIVLETAELSGKGGVHGDSWAKGCWRSLPDGSPDPDVQITLMNSRAIALLARSRSRWPLAGDQLFVDLDLSTDNLKPGDELSVGGARLRITEQPHNGCKKFRERFGSDALRYVNSELGRRLHLRGIYARVVRDGTIRVGDPIFKV